MLKSIVFTVCEHEYMNVAPPPNYRSSGAPVFGRVFVGDTCCIVIVFTSAALFSWNFTSRSFTVSVAMMLLPLFLTVMSHLSSISSSRLPDCEIASTFLYILIWSDWGPCTSHIFCPKQEISLVYDHVCSRNICNQMWVYSYLVRRPSSSLEFCWSFAFWLGLLDTLLTSAEGLKIIEAILLLSFFTCFLDYSKAL